MKWIAASLWEMFAPPATLTPKALPMAGNGRAKSRAVRRVIVPGETIQQDVRRRVEGSATASLTQARARPTMQQKYDALVEEMKHTHSLRIRKWRRSSSGVAWTIRYRDGREVKLIEAPYPRGPMSCAIFLHEVGHHAIGLGVHRPRCLEEYHVWVWAVREMRERGFNVTPAVEKRVRDSLRYAVRKAARRGLRSLPAELHAYA